MASRPLHPDVTLAIDISAIMSRHKYTTDPGPVIAELRETAGARSDLLAAEVGSFIGYYDNEKTRPLTDALLAAFADLDMRTHIDLGRTRRDAPRRRS